MPCFSHCLSKNPFAIIRIEKGYNTFCYLPESIKFISPEYETFSVFKEATKC